MPVNTVIIIALAVMVLLMVAAFFFSSTGNISATNLESAWSNGCHMLKNTYHCNPDKLIELKVADINGDGSPDALLDICRAKYGSSMSKYMCRNKCCGTLIVEGTSCEVKEDCQFGWDKGTWECNPASAGTPDPACCPEGKSWNGDNHKCE
ncbi:MAG: hypothetical protein KAU95_04135 [Candidatus Aenigmarchaeota archaeon]|nr:hypothetical protein [Candidatus Aenigmarchaeota archaeon]